MRSLVVIFLFLFLCSCASSSSSFLSFPFSVTPSQSAPSSSPSGPAQGVTGFPLDQWVDIEFPNRTYSAEQIGKVLQTGVGIGHYLVKGTEKKKSMAITWPEESGYTFLLVLMRVKGIQGMEPRRGLWGR
jgi:hypothetical protein